MLKDPNLIVPAQVEFWFSELKNPKNSQFQRDLYEDRLRALHEHIAINLPPPRKRRT